MQNTFPVTPIAYVESPYQEKFAIPRQPGLATAAKGKINFLNEFNNLDLVKGLEQFSHIWLIFHFHQTAEQGWKPLVRPPRLGGNDKMGVLATRSTFRPNAIGMSVVKLDDIDYQNKQLSLAISSLDLLNGTPIIDIKPYLPYADALSDATSSFANIAPENSVTVCFSEQAKQTLAAIKHNYLDLKTLIVQVLSQDPRPAYKKQQEDNKLYGISLYDLNIQWQMKNASTIEVLKIAKAL